MTTQLKRAPVVENPDTSEGGSNRATTGLQPTALLAQQQRMAEGMAAAGQKYLEGMQEVASRSLQLQTTLFQRSIMATFGLLRASNPHDAEQAGREAAAAMEATVTSIGDIMQTACKCGMDAMEAFREQMAGESNDRSRHAGR